MLVLWMRQWCDNILETTVVANKFNIQGGASKSSVGGKNVEKDLPEALPD